MVVGLDQRKDVSEITPGCVDWLAQARVDVEQGLAKEVVVDLSTVEKITSSQLSELIRLQLLVKQSGRRLVLENLQENVLQVFTVTRLDRLIDLRINPQTLLVSPLHEPQRRKRR